MLAAAWALGWLLLLAIAGSSAVAAAEPADEARVRAAYLLNFMRYSKWPAPESGPLHVAVLGTAENVAVLRSVAASSGGINGRPVHVRLLPLASLAPELGEATAAIAEETASSHVIYIGPTHRSWSRAVAAAAARRPVLTVGPGAGFLEEGGMIGLYLEQGNVRFDVNAAAIKASRVDVSSRLMTMARSARRR